jgi:hypothetical protein
MSTAVAIASSAAVAGVVSGGVSYLSQSRLLRRKAEVDYEYEARKRLNDAIGPLRFEFLLAARDLESRVIGHAELLAQPGERWNMDPADYYASSFIYRILHPIAVGELIERHVAYADFSVDPGAIKLLRALKAMERALSGSEVLLGHPQADWASESQHLFRQNVRVAGAALVTGGERPTVMPFADFRVVHRNPSADPRLAALARIFAACRTGLLENPLFWLRLVAYGYVCADLVRDQGSSLGFDDRTYDVGLLLAGVPDEQIRSRSPSEYEAVFQAIMSRGL